MTLVATADDAKPPRIATDLAILHERATRVGLDVNLDLLATIRTDDDELVVHIVRARPAPSRPRPAFGSRLRATRFDAQAARRNRRDLVLYRNRCE
jgi:hypothetical protein